MSQNNYLALHLKEPLAKFQQDQEEMSKLQKKIAETKTAPFHNTQIEQPKL